MTRIDIDQSAKQNKLSFILGNYLKNKITAVFALFLILGGFYVFQINQLAVLGYKIKEIEKENTKFKKEVMQLEINVEKMKAATNLQTKTQELNMIQSKNINYVYIEDGNLAMSNRNTARY